ncbi:thiamine pyrophosphate-binding protein [Egicoccus halophilus]|uniref:Acetolactate synthase I/II/III large subunit n=1 Tax=Egicoccus halophilus TaxID=1670830 RepID=A0A8J3ABY0_9ACTN|nr:thiamine pyrophosphate-binding protein [Egicoccus halophilus]GGI08000.1 acetolactate synthase I/II/III large subunit [Egicoccus halophilus]
MTPTVAEVVGRTLADLGVRRVFGVVGSGNFAVTNALLAAGADYVAARHEGGAATMADAWARTSGEVGAVSLHQGCGLTNALTGVTEAAKSRTPLVVLAAETAAGARQANFRVDQPALAAAVGAVSLRVTGAATAAEEAARAVATARAERRTVVLQLPLDVQAMPAAEDVAPAAHPVAPTPPSPAPEAVVALARRLAEARRPVLVAGRGARHAAAELRALAHATGALLATSAVAKGLFAADPWSLDVAGGFSTPLAAELLRSADLVVAFGCALNGWTTRHGRLIGPGATIVQVDLDAAAIGTHRRVDLAVIGDSRSTAAAVTLAVTAGPDRGREAADGYRSEAVAARLRAGRRWRDVDYDDWGGGGRIDPRTLTIALDDLLPAERVVAVDSGNFMGYPSMFLEVPDERGFCFTQAFQSVGLGLATAIGAALAQPDRLPVAAVGDGGLLMGASELDTVTRLGLPMVVVVYDDGGYGAEVHHFGDTADLRTVTFPPTDHAAIARGYGYAAVTVRDVDDLAPVRTWLDGPRERPLLVDAKIAAPRGSWWLEEAFRGH